jgi:hypothetical protein
MIFRKNKIWLSIGENKLEGKVAKITLQILVMTLSIEGGLYCSFLQFLT